MRESQIDGTIETVTVDDLMDFQVIRRMRLALLVAFHLSAVASGIASAYLAGSSRSSVLIAATSSIAATGWCALDSMLHRNTLALKWVMLALSPISSLAYLTWTRGLKGLGWGLLNLLGFSLISTAVNLAMRLI